MLIIHDAMYIRIKANIKPTQNALSLQCVLLGLDALLGTLAKTQCSRLRGQTQTGTMRIHPLLDRFEYYLVLKESCSYIPIELLGYLLVMRTEITQLRREITRIFLVYRCQKILGIHQKHIRMNG